MPKSFFDRELTNHVTISFDNREWNHLQELADSHDVGVTFLARIAALAGMEQLAKLHTASQPVDALK